MYFRKRGITSSSPNKDAYARITSKHVEQAEKHRRRKETRPVFVLMPLMLAFAMVVSLVYFNKHVVTSFESFIGGALHRQKLNHRSSRFPIFGTKEFEKECKWAIPPPESSEPACSIFFSQLKSNEGIANWVAKVPQLFQFARYKGCRPLFGYWKGVDVSAVVVPPDIHVWNWTVSDDFNCLGTKTCNLLTSYKEKHIHQPLFLRFAYTFYGKPTSRESFKDIQKSLEGYRPESSVACSLGALFQLSPTANKFQPDLFTKIIPTLQDENALVLALYMRTHRSDEIVRSEQQPDKYPLREENQKSNRKMASNFEACAFSLEEQYLSGMLEPDQTFSRVIWMVITDSQDLKEYMAATYSGQDANLKLAESKQKWKSKVIPREVLTTRSRGKHTKTNHKVDTVAFAEAFIDWYLLGESDAVLVDKHSSFGPMGAMRTSRPVYRPTGGCSAPVAWLEANNASIV